MNIMGLLIPKSRTAYLYDDYSLRQGLEKMRFHGYRVIPVIDRKGLYVGTVGEGDFLWDMVDRSEYSIESQEKHILKEILHRSEDNPPVHHNESITNLLSRARQNNFVPVIDDRGCYIGIVTRRDIINFFADKYLGGIKEND